MLGLTAVMAWKECKPAQVQDATGQGMKKKKSQTGEGDLECEDGASGGLATGM